MSTVQVICSCNGSIIPRQNKPLNPRESLDLPCYNTPSRGLQSFGAPQCMGDIRLIVVWLSPCLWCGNKG